MSYGGLMYDYTYPLAYEDDDEVDYWIERHPPQYTTAPRATVNPTQLEQQPRSYEASRDYESSMRYYTNNRGSNSGVYVSQIAPPNMPVMRSHREVDEYDFEQQTYEKPQIMIECPTRSSKSQRYYCEFESCVDPETGVRKSVSRRADLKRHVHSVHGRPTIDCEYKKCWRRGEDGFCRPDHYREHLRGYHNQELPRSGGRRRGS